MNNQGALFTCGCGFSEFPDGAVVLTKYTVRKISKEGDALEAADASKKFVLIVSEDAINFFETEDSETGFAKLNWKSFVDLLMAKMDSAKGVPLTDEELNAQHEKWVFVLHRILQTIKDAHTRNLVDQLYEEKAARDKLEVRLEAAEKRSEEEAREWKAKFDVLESRATTAENELAYEKRRRVGVMRY